MVAGVGVGVRVGVGVGVGGGVVVVVVVKRKKKGRESKKQKQEKVSTYISISIQPCARPCAFLRLPWKNHMFLPYRITKVTSILNLPEGGLERPPYSD